MTAGKKITLSDLQLARAARAIKAHLTNEELRQRFGMEGRRVKILVKEYLLKKSASQ